MNDPGNGNGNGSDRATVAMVLRTVDQLKELTAANFGTVNAHLEDLKDGAAATATKVERLDGEVRALSIQCLRVREDFDRHEKETNERIASEIERGKFWRRSAPTLLIAAAASLPGWIALLLPT